jgi:DNA-binding Lrp family transcriptional regulator
MSSNKRALALPRETGYIRAPTDRQQRVDRGFCLEMPSGINRAIFVMIKCELGEAYRVAREAADTIPQLSEMFSTSGQYDLLGKFYLEPDQDIGLFVTERVQTLAGVKDTNTLITFNAFGGGGGT